MSKPFYKQSKYWVLFVFVTLIVFRFAFPSYETNEEDSKKETVIQNVRVDTINSISFENELKYFANTLPVKQTVLYSKYDGDISHIYKKQGELVNEGEAILKIKDNGLESNLQSTILALEEATVNFDSAKRLQKNQLISKADYIKAETAYNRAVADKKSAQVSYDDSIVTANFTGRLEDFDFEVGDYIERGQSLATLNDLSQLKAYVHVPEIHIPLINESSLAYIQFPNRKVEAKVNYISRVGNEDTHTFKVEILTSQEENLISGLSAPIYIKVPKEKAYELSMGILNLDSEGNPSVKAINENNEVVTYDLEIITSSKNGVVVRGLTRTLPDSLNVITIGHLLTTAGEKVNPTFQKDVK